MSFTLKMSLIIIDMIWRWLPMWPQSLIASATALFKSLPPRNAPSRSAPFTRAVLCGVLFLGCIAHPAGQGDLRNAEIAAASYKSHPTQLTIRLLLRSRHQLERSEPYLLLRLERSTQLRFYSYLCCWSILNSCKLCQWWARSWQTLSLWVKLVNFALCLAVFMNGI